MARRAERNPDFIGTLIELSGFGVVGLILVNAAKSGGFGSVLPVLGGSAPNGSATGPANTSSPGGNEFNLNTDVNTSHWTVANSAAGLGDVLIDCHVGLGHAGSGGQFVCVLTAQADGLFGLPFGTGAPVELARQAFSTNGDNDWTGYGVDFSGVRVTSGIQTVGIYASIYDSSGVFFQKARIPQGG